MIFNMLSSLCLFVILLVTTEASKTRWYELEAKGYNHDMYMTEFGKMYSSEKERLYRKRIFDDKLFQIKVHNKKNLSWKEGVNQFTDRTPEEMMNMNGYRGDKLPARLALQEHVLTGKSIPSNVDYRKQPGVLTAVKDQGNCGSCWAVSATSTVESQWFIATGLSTDLSMQQVASCTSNPHHIGGFGGCHGSFPQFAFASIIEAGGITTEWDYPYISYYGSDYPCKFINNKTKNPIAKLSNLKNTKPNDYQGLMDTIANVGPISIVIDSRDWHHYESGIFNNCNSSVLLDHAVQLVGYGSESGTDYWIIRNSWGTVFGEHGFIRLYREASPPCDSYNHTVPLCGACGVLTIGTYPIIQTD